ncbi:exodeoxyribonuclease VII small subunit [Chondrinema litorale]|uniref:exodeoxyribonuclease VII small subunit n=1 Tax=Chondrinema litorale TaxID=2994555 RepID=UPI0025434939|nr:exodeoxyribonuclease VII small subunit [Chondrinema litorale]UZR94278.1 exodeoxyribonuclease VII small subunit [Chondrinema litorale]
MEKNETNINYEEALAELEEIRDALEDDLVSVDDLSEKVKRAYWLISYCKGRLIKTEEDLTSLLQNDEA